MSRLEVEQLFQHDAPPIIGAVESFSISSDPERAPFNSDLAWMCAGLKNTLFNSSEGLDLIPLSKADLENGFPHRLMDAWSNKQLRKGYLPQLPDKYLPITNILKAWIDEPIGVTYRVTHSSHVDTLGFIQAEFNSPRDNDLYIDINYGNVHPARLRKGLITNALGVLIKGLQDEIPRYGFNLRKIVTNVSNRNMGSIKILRRNGFKPDYTRPITNAPIVMGGYSIPVSIEF